MDVCVRLFSQNYEDYKWDKTIDYCHCSVPASGQFIINPINQALVAGDKAKFQWQLEINVTRWKWAILRPSSLGNIENIVTSNLGTVSRFSDNFSHFQFFSDKNSCCVMSTEAVKLEDGGNYTLEYRIENRSRAFAVQLTVLGSSSN